MRVIANAILGTEAKAVEKAAEHRAAQALLAQLGVVLMDDPELGPTPPATPVAAAPTPGIDPVVGQQLVAAKAVVDEVVKKAEQTAMDREAELVKLKAELAAVNRQALTDHREASLRVADLEDLWKQENVAKLVAEAEVVKLKAELAALKAAVPPSGLLGIIPPDVADKIKELGVNADSQEGKAFLAAFAAGEDGTIDMVRMAVTPIVEAIVGKIPADQLNIAGRAAELLGDMLMDALRARVEEEEEKAETEPELVPVQDPVTLPPPAAPRQHPLKKGKARRVTRHGPLEELADLVGTGELRVRAA